MPKSLQDFKDAVARAATGMTKSEAHEKGICIKCKENWEPKTHTELGRREYRISGYCEDCWDAMFDIGDSDFPLKPK